MHLDKGQGQARLVLMGVAFFLNNADSTFSRDVQMYCVMVGKEQRRCRSSINPTCDTIVGFLLHNTLNVYTWKSRKYILQHWIYNNVLYKNGLLFENRDL